eukprot:2514521-Amphidinium_carterae.2
MVIALQRRTCPSRAFPGQVAALLLMQLPMVPALTDITCSSSNYSHCPKYDLDFFDQFIDEGLGCCLPEDSDESYCGTEDECGTFYEHLSTGLVIYLMFQSSCCLCVALCCTAA